MSENVTPLYPDKERKRKARRRIFSMAGIVVLVLLAVFVILFHQQLNLDRIRRFFTYRSVSCSETYGQYTFDAHNSNAYRAFDGGLAVASVAGLDLYGPSGEELVTIPKAMGAPAVAAGDNLVMAYDVGGKSILAANGKSGSLLELETDRPIFDVDVSQDGQICYAAASDAYKTVLTVLDEKQKEKYQWYSSSQYLPLCAIADGGAQLAAVAVGQSDGVFESSLRLFSTDQEEAGPVTSLGNQLILDVDFVDAKRICTVGEHSMAFFDLEGAQQGTYSYEDQYLKDFDLSGNGFVALSLNMYQAGSRFSVVTVDFDGQEMANLLVGAEILSISAAGNYLAVLTDAKLQIYTSDLTLYAETEELYGASSVAMRDDGSALLIGSGGAHLYLP